MKTLSPSSSGLGWFPAPVLARCRVCALALVCLFAMVATARAAGTRDGVYAQRARVAFEQAQAQYRSQMDDPVIAWNFARTCYDWADWATNRAQRATIAREGIAACHQSLLITNSTAAHYYLAMNMGQLAQSDGLGALKLVREMQSEFLTAANLDPATDFGGPERGLGLLCRDAPGWPLSIGNRSRAQQFLEQAVTLAPNYPENVLNLAESEFMWGQKADAKKELAKLDSLWPAAQKVLAGEKWEQSWDDWSKRRDALRTKLDQ